MGELTWEQKEEVEQTQEKIWAWEPTLEEVEE